MTLCRSKSITVFVAIFFTSIYVHKLAGLQCNPLYVWIMCRVFFSGYAELFNGGQLDGRLNLLCYHGDIAKTCSFTLIARVFQTQTGWQDAIWLLVSFLEWEHSSIRFWEWQYWGRIYELAVALCCFTLFRLYGRVDMD